nr:MAG TPA: hypothetical protein [Caudoviricetes sp.]
MYFIEYILLNLHSTKYNLQIYSATRETGMCYK